MYELISFHPNQYNAIYSQGGRFYSMSPPYIHTSLITDSDLSSSLSLAKKEKKFRTAEGLRDELLLRYFFTALNNFHDLVKKINEGSMIVKSLEDINKKLVVKIETFSFLKDDNPLLLRHFLHTFWLFLGVNGHDAEALFHDVVKGSDIDNLVLKDMKLFAQWKTDKVGLIGFIHQNYLLRFKKEEKWEAYKNACFSLLLLSDLLGYESKESIKTEYNIAIEEYESLTGRDAHHTPFKRHADRRSREQHMKEKWEKRKNRNKNI